MYDDLQTKEILSNPVMQALAQILSPAVKEIQQKVTASGTPSTPYLHGPGGLFGVAGIERDLFHTRIRGNGLAATLPTFGVQTTNPFFGYITGFQDVSGSVPDGVCDDPEIAGQMKTCIQTAPLGRFSFQTRELEINRVGELINRGEFNDLRLLNDPLAPILGQSMFPSISGNGQVRAGAEVLSRMLELGIAFSNRIGRRLYNGTPANNSAGGGYREPMGLDILIGTTKVDALTGQDCPSLHSDIKDMNYVCVDDETANPDIVRVMTTMWRFVNHISSQTGLNPAQWVWSMRTNLFHEITDMWACRYWSYRCTVVDSAGINPTPMFNSADAIQLRDAMRNGNYLLIDGVRVPVVLDDYIVEETEGDAAALGPGQFASDIYLVPLTVLGGTPVTFWQYFDFQGGPMEAIVDGRQQAFFWTDNGRYLWTSDRVNWCVVWEAKTEPRIILRTPQIAGRITNVCYEPLQHYRDVHPEDPYHVDGGVTTRDAPSLFEDWSGAAE